LIGHAHFDHEAGSAELIRETGAEYMVMDGDVPGGRKRRRRGFRVRQGLFPRTLAPRHRLAQQELDLRIHAAQIIRRPFFELFE
jgi:glyoxylase-like metal-dependent hydrolase (beta-lactamase superfamily II)